MTKTVKLSITVQADDGEEKRLDVKTHPESLSQDITELTHALTQLVGTETLNAIERHLKANEYAQGKVIRTSERTYHYPGFSLTCRRRSYKMPDGTEHTPLDKILGFEKYQRRSWELKEQTCALASDLNYRSAAHIQSYMSQKSVSASTVCRDVQELGCRIAEQELAFLAEEPGKIKAPVLYCESDGILIPLQHSNKKKAEVRVAITYTGKKHISQSRKKLENKLILASVGLNSPQWQSVIRERLCATYDIDHTQCAYIAGDGASWVNHSFDLIGNMPMIKILDPYHVKKAVRQAFADVTDINDLLSRLYKHGFDTVEAELCDITANGDEKRVKARLDCLQYLRNHKDEIIQDPSMGSIESNVGKLIAQRMKTRGVSWCEKGAKGMVALLRYKQELYEHSFPYKNISTQKSADKRKQKGDEGSVHKASFPVLKSGKISAPYAKLFKSICYGDLPFSA